MTVRELIDLLSKYPEQNEVAMVCAFDTCRIHSIHTRDEFLDAIVSGTPTPLHGTPQQKRQYYKEKASFITHLEFDAYQDTIFLLTSSTGMP